MMSPSLCHTCGLVRMTTTAEVAAEEVGVGVGETPTLVVGDTAER